MRITYLLLIGLLLLQNLSFAEELIPDKNQVILTKESKYFSHKVEWIPTKKNTAKALNAIYEFLQNSDEHKPYSEFAQNELKLILKRFPNYRVQFMGIVIAGKKIIHCNFFPINESFSYWKDSYVFVFDGGYSFWRVDYDINTSKCFNFESNGYA